MKLLPKLFAATLILVCANAFAQDTWRTFDASKDVRANGLKFSIDYPSDWIPLESNQDGVIQRFRSPDDTAFVRIGTIPLELPATVKLDAQDIESLLSSDVLKAMIPTGGSYVSLTESTISGYPVRKLRFLLPHQVINSQKDLEVILVIFVLNNSLVKLEFGVLTPPGGDSKMLYARNWPVFERMIDSIRIDAQSPSPQSLSPQSQLKAESAVTLTDMLQQRFGHNWQAGMLFSFALTWVIGLVPPLLIRFALVRKQLSKKATYAICTILFVVNVFIFNLLGSKNYTVSVWVTVAFVSYFILRRAGKETAAP